MNSCTRSCLPTAFLNSVGVDFLGGERVTDCLPAKRYPLISDSVAQERNNSEVQSCKSSPANPYGGFGGFMNGFDETCVLHFMYFTATLRET